MLQTSKFSAALNRSSKVRRALSGCAEMVKFLVQGGVTVVRSSVHKAAVSEGLKSGLDAFISH
jgi:hypothetical protein